MQESNSLDYTTTVKDLSDLCSADKDDPSIRQKSPISSPLKSISKAKEAQKCQSGLSEIKLPLKISDPYAEVFQEELKEQNSPLPNLMVTPSVNNSGQKFDFGKKS